MTTATNRIQAKNVDEYLQAFPPSVRTILTKIRRTIQAAAPGVEEKISYGIPGYQYKGMLIYFAGFKNHVSVYPAPRTAEPFKKILATYKGGKGTVQFPLDKPVPLDLIKKIVQYRIKTNEEKAGKAMARAAPTPSDPEKVRAWLSQLDPAVKKEITAVRKMIRESSPLLSERIKWNAPSYYYQQDILTFGPYKKDKILLVFHHPAVVKVKSALLEGDYKDRRLVYFKNKTEAAGHKKELARIIGEIIRFIDKKQVK